MGKKNKSKSASKPEKAVEVESNTPEETKPLESPAVEAAEVTEPANTPEPATTEETKIETLETTKKDDSSNEEVEKLRAQLEQFELKLASKEKEIEELKEKEEATSEVHSKAVAALQEKHENFVLEAASAKESSDDNVVKELKTQLEVALKAKAESEQNYQGLLGRIGNIKATLGERLKADMAELSQCKEKIKQLEQEKTSLSESIENERKFLLESSEIQKKSLTDSVETLKREVIQANRENDSLSQQLSATRTEYQNSISQWEKQHDQLTKQNRTSSEELDKNKNLVRSLEVSLQEERTLRSSLSSRISDMEEQITSQTNYAEQYRRERDEFKKKVDTLTQEQQSDSASSKATIEQLTDQIEKLKEQLETSKQETEKQQTKISEMEKVNNSIPELERQVKEKNLQLGKLRHEAVTLNEHLTKALRMLQKNSQGDTVDKQLVTNMLLSFLSLPRADTKRFEVLQLISNYLGWDDDQNIQAGLRSSAGGAAGTPAGLNSPRTPSSSRFPGGESGGGGGSGGFMSMFADFLERESTRPSSNGSKK